MARLIEKISVFMIVVTWVVVSVYGESHGIATFYTKYIPSACYGNHQEGDMIAAVSQPLWKNGAACGTRYQVTCVDGPACRGSRTVTVKIVDLCPSPSCRGTIDLSQEAFASIADPNAGVIKISFQQI